MEPLVSPGIDTPILYIEIFISKSSIPPIKSLRLYNFIGNSLTANSLTTLFISFIFEYKIDLSDLPLYNKEFFQLFFQACKIRWRVTL
ncbi:hypothetical protein COA27_29015 [Bacillus cereus]|nr:hypothetical protein COJ06_02310 [Bacillus cereus]PGQ65026.1 hypothetical protein COA27_29015 [Bacillus cereus]